MLKAGIIGLPNVGKSSLFNTLTKAQALAANYPFATIEPNVGVVQLKDERLDILAKMYNPKKVIPTSFQFIDIAGLVKGASKGEGLGNKFLAQIREVDAICEVVRCFDDNNITHVLGRINPLDDIDIIKTELYLADLEVIEKRLPKLEKQTKTGDKTYLMEYNALLKINVALTKNQNPRFLDLSKEELLAIKSYNFLSLKPFIYLLNISEDRINTFENSPTYKEILDYANKEKSEVVIIPIKLEVDISEFSDEEKKEVLAEYKNISDAINMLTAKTYHLLGLRTFFTVGPDECRAWTFLDGSLAPDCAGIIHTDFKKGFIAAEVISYDELINNKTYELAKANGKVRIEGKNYLVKDGDIMLFRFNV